MEAIQKHYTVARALAWFTIIYNLAEGIISTFYGFEEETLSLFGFGVDSFIEMISSIGILVMIFRIEKNPNSPNSTFEKKALQLTGYCLYALAIILVLTAAVSIYEAHIPQDTLPGIIISCVSIGIMYVLIKEKIKVGKAFCRYSGRCQLCPRVHVYVYGAIGLKFARVFYPNTVYRRHRSHWYCVFFLLGRKGIFTKSSRNARLLVP
jgi:hypothetical protein